MPNTVGRFSNFFNFSHRQNFGLDGRIDGGGVNFEKECNIKGRDRIQLWSR